VYRAQQGDRDAFSELVHLLSPRLLRTALRLVKDRADAEDVVQMALLSAFQHLATFRRESSLSTWLTRIAVNEGHNLLNRKRRETANVTHISPERTEDHRYKLRSPQPNPEQNCLIAEMRRFFRRGLDAIDPAYANILRMRVLDQLKYREIAKLQGLSVSSVKTRIHRARRMLQKLDAEWAYSGSRCKMNLRISVNS
jgi:RNA polymerase sigma-70 factor (ECF subfamily)